MGVPMSSGERLKKGQYTDADILALYTKYREAGIGPFIREVGDFIAHSKRDRGATLDTTAYMFAQLAFFQTYQGEPKQPLKPKGKCGWWLRHYLLTKAKEANEGELQNAVSLTKKQVKNIIKSWFPDKKIYSTRINCNDPRILFDLASLFCRTIVGKNVFDLAQAKSEITKIFDKEGIDHEEMERFLIGTAILLTGKSVEIVSGFTANIDLGVGTARHIPFEKEGEATDSTKPQYGIMLPDGNLKISVLADNDTGDGLVSVGLDFLDTEIDTEKYFSREFITINEHRIPRLNLDRQLSFDSTANPPVKEVAS